MSVNYITIYRSEIEYDSIFEDYCLMPNAIVHIDVDPDEDFVTFYTMPKPDSQEES